MENVTTNHLRIVPEKRKILPYGLICWKIFNSKCVDDLANLETRRQLVFFGVKALNFISIYKNDLDDGKINWTENLYQMSKYILALIGSITPRELMSIFPISKIYNGNKTGTKDYFYTMGECEKIGLDNLIGLKRSGELLWDYDNRHLREFTVHQMAVSNEILRKCRPNQPDPFEAFFMMAGAKTKTVSTDSQGRKFLYDPDEKKFHRLGKKKLNYGKARI